MISFDINSIKFLKILSDSTHKKRILTGIRPTGALHLGHYVGALKNWIDLQNQFDCYFLIADYQALGDHFNDIDLIRGSVLDVTLDWMAVGLDPDKSSFVIQSYVPEFAELSMLLSFITPIGMLERNPTLKNELDDLDEIFRKKNTFKGKIGIFEIKNNKIHHKLNLYKVDDGMIKEIF